MCALLHHRHCLLLLLLSTTWSQGGGVRCVDIHDRAIYDGIIPFYFHHHHSFIAPTTTLSSLLLLLPFFLSSTAAMKKHLINNQIIRFDSYLFFYLKHLFFLFFLDLSRIFFSPPFRPSRYVFNIMFVP